MPEERQVPKTDPHILAYETAKARGIAARRVAPKIPADPKPTPRDLANDPLARKESEKLRSGNYHREHQQLLELRKTWSRWLIVWISFSLVFQAFMFVAIGLKILTFDSHPNLPAYLLGVVLIEVIGMGYILIKWLFPTRLR